MTTDAVLTMPSHLDLQETLNVVSQLVSLPEASRYRLDFSRLKFLEPFGMLHFSSQLRRFRQAHPNSRFNAEHYDHLGYAAHMGFFQAFGLNHGKEPGEASGSQQYVPITRLDLNELRQEAIEQYEDVRESLERISMKLAGVLVRDDAGPLHDTITYSLREIFRNVIEHSKANSIWYAAQYWPEKGWVELSILDEGIGIAATLGRNPHLKITSEADALQLALLPGVSGVAFKGGPKQRKDPWANSGYGLFMTSQLCLRGGTFVIISGSGGLLLQNQEQSKLDCTFKGTAIRLQFHVPEIQELSGALEGLRQRGTEIVGTMQQVANISASMSSRMLISKDRFNCS
jgi:hypothetical protein